MNYIKQIRKALVPAGVSLVLLVLGTVGIGPEMTVGNAVTTLVDAALLGFLVWLIPNDPA